MCTYCIMFRHPECNEVGRSPLTTTRLHQLFPCSPHAGSNPRLGEYIKFFRLHEPDRFRLPWSSIAELKVEIAYQPRNQLGDFQHGDMSADAGSRPQAKLSGKTLGPGFKSFGLRGEHTGTQCLFISESLSFSVSSHRLGLNSLASSPKIDLLRCSTQVLMPTCVWVFRSC